MKVTIAVPGRAHAFDVARELHKRNALHHVITAFPRFRARQFDVPTDRVTSLLWFGLLARMWQQYTPDAAKRRWDANPWLFDTFDRAAASAIPQGTTVFLGWTCKAKWGMLRAREMGALAIVDRSSSHERYVHRIMAEECARYAPDHYQIPQCLVDRVTEEFEIADYILVPSSFAERTLVEEGVDQRKIIKIPLGVDLKLFYPAPKQDAVFRVVFVGSMELRKGVHYLLQAFHELALPDAELWLIGGMTPAMAPILRRYEGSYKYWGRIPNAVLREHLSQCSVLALCSIEDGFGMVISQAMACGLPVICTVNTAATDVVRPGVDGFVIPIRDVAAIKEKILFCYQNQSTCREMGQAALSQVRKQQTWSGYAEHLCRAVGQALTTHKVRPCGHSPECR